MKKLWAILLVVSLLFSISAPALAAQKATATTLRLEKTEGTVETKNASGKVVSKRAGTRLYSGYQVSTQKASYAYISLDDAKAIKLDASSTSEVRQSGKNLEVTVLSGKMFFDVTEPLKANEQLTIRTSTMVTGVRGTCGWVEVVDCFTTRISLLEGMLIITSTDPLTGTQRTTTIVGGQTATIVYHGEDQDYESEIIIEDETIQDLIDEDVIHDEHIILTGTGLTVENLQEEDVPGFVAVEVEKDKDLQKRIEDTTDLSVPEIIGDAEERLEKEEAAAEAEDQAIQEELEKVTADDVDPLFKAETPSSGGGSSNENVTPVQYNFAVVSNFYDASGSEALEANELQGHVAAGSVQTITVPEGYELVQLIVNDTIVEEITTPPTVVVNSDTVVSATFLSTTTIYLEKDPGVTTVNTALSTYDDVFVTGTVSADNANIITLNGGKTLHFIGTDTDTETASALGSGVTLSTQEGSSVIVEEGTFANNGGTINGKGTITVLSGATLENNASIQIESTDSLHVQGYLLNNYTIDVGTENGQGLLALESDGKTGGLFINTGTLTITAGSSVTAAAGATLTNGENGYIINSGTLSVASNAAMNNYGTLNLAPNGFRCEGTYTDNRDAELLAMIKDGSAITWVGAASALPDTVPSGSEVQLFGAASGTMTNINSTFTLDLNGRQVGSLPNFISFTVQQGLTLTLKDSSGTNAGAFTNRVSNNGALIVESGTITAASGAGLINTATGSLTINGGIIGGDSCDYGIQNNGGSVAVSGGTISGGTAIQSTGGAVTIAGGTTTGTDRFGIDASDALITMDGSGVVQGLLGGIYFLDTGIVASNAAGINVKSGTVSTITDNIEVITYGIEYRYRDSNIGMAYPVAIGNLPLYKNPSTLPVTTIYDSCDPDGNGEYNTDPEAIIKDDAAGAKVTGYGALLIALEPN